MCRETLSKTPGDGGGTSAVSALCGYGISRRSKKKKKKNPPAAISRSEPFIWEISADAIVRNRVGDNAVLQSSGSE